MYVINDQIYVVFESRVTISRPNLSYATAIYRNGDNLRAYQEGDLLYIIDDGSLYVIDNGVVSLVEEDRYSVDIRDYLRVSNNIVYYMTGEEFDNDIMGKSYSLDFSGLYLTDTTVIGMSDWFEHVYYSYDAETGELLGTLPEQLSTLTTCNDRIYTKVMLGTDSTSYNYYLAEYNQSFELTRVHLLDADSNILNLHCDHGALYKTIISNQQLSIVELQLGDVNTDPTWVDINTARYQNTLYYFAIIFFFIPIFRKKDRWFSDPL